MLRITILRDVVCCLLVTLGLAQAHAEDSNLSPFNPPSGWQMYHKDGANPYNVYVAETEDGTCRIYEFPEVRYPNMLSENDRKLLELYSQNEVIISDLYENGFRTGDYLIKGNVHLTAKGYNVIHDVKLLLKDNYVSKNPLNGHLELFYVVRNNRLQTFVYMQYPSSNCEWSGKSASDALSRLGRGSFLAPPTLEQKQRELDVEAKPDNTGPYTSCYQHCAMMGMACNVHPPRINDNFVVDCLAEARECQRLCGIEYPID